MEYKKKNLGSYQLHLMKTKKFKTIKVRISFRRPIKKGEITMRNALCNMLVYSTKKCPTKRDFIIKTQDLYASTITSNNSRFGNYIKTDLNLTVLNDKYTEEGNTEKALEFLQEVIYEVNEENQKFDEKSLEIIKKQMQTSLETMKEDASYYAMIRLFEEMGEDSPISYRMCGYIDDLENITGAKLYQYYQGMINQDLMDIFVVGDIDFETAEEMIKKYFPVKTFKKKKLKYMVNSEKPRRRKQMISEKLENNQSKLAIGCRMTGLTEYERNYPLTLYNIILGSGTDSKLFKEVREKNSLCYTISSVPNKLDHILLIRAGVDRKNVKKTISLIESQLTKMKKGKFTETDIKVAKEYYQTALDSIYESESSMIDTYFTMDLLGLDPLDMRRKKMEEVAAADIMKVAKKIKIDTVFCLEGVNE